MISPYEAVAAAINRRPAFVAGIIICAIIIAFYGTTLTSMETGTDTYVDKDTGRSILLNQYADTFQSSTIMLLVEGDDVLSPDVLEYLAMLGDDIRNERYVSSVSTIADVLTGANGGTLPRSRAEISRAEEQAPESVLSSMVPSQMMTIGVITLEPGLSESSEFGIINSIASICEHSGAPPGVSVKVTGNAAFSQQMSDEMGTSMGTLILAAMALMVIAVGILFGSVRYRLLSVGIVASGLILTFGVMGLAGMKISMVTIAAFPVLIGIGIDYAIQFHSRLDEEVRTSPLPVAIRTTITKSGPSILYAMLATSMGFIAMWISPLPMIRSFGQVCVIGVFSCYIAAILIVPTFATIVHYRPVEVPAGRGPGMVERYDAAIGALVGKVARHPVPVLIACALIAFGGMQVDGFIKVNTNEKTFVPPGMPAKVDLDKVTRVMGPSSSTPIFVRGDGVATIDGLAWIREFQEYEERDYRITGSHSIVDEILQYNDGKMPQSDAEVDRALARIPEARRDRYLSGNSMALIEFSTIAMDNDVGMSFIEKMQQDIAWIAPPPGITATITGEGEMFTNLIREIREGKTTMTLLGFAMIFGFLFLVYRRIGKAVTPLVPIALIVGWNALIMYVLGIDYTPMTATLGSMTIGVASEYTILIMERCYEEQANGAPLLEAIRQSVQKIGTAITVSGLTTVFGFSALMLSAFGIISNFGVLTVISVAFSLAGAIVIMPAILALTGKERDAAPTAEKAALST